MKNTQSPRTRLIGTFARLILSVVVVACFAASAFSLPVEAITPINNREYAPAVRTLFQNAKKRILLHLYQARYYPEYPDTATNYFLTDLIAAKKRGVDVKVLMDMGDWNPSNKNEYNADFCDRLTTSGIEIWYDSPTDVSHEKVIVVDETITVVSSHNWTFYSLAKNNEVGVVIFSPEVNAWFTRYWADHAKLGQPKANTIPASLELANYKAPANAGAATGSLTGADLKDFRKYPAADVEPIADRLFYPAMHREFLNAKQSIDVVQRSLSLYDNLPRIAGKSPLPGEPASMTNVLAEDLVSAHKRGVKVQVILSTPEGFDTSDSDKTAAYLMPKGVAVYHDDPKVQTHAKMAMVDSDKTIVGSTNWTYPAIEQGNEASVIVTSPEVNKVYQDYVATILKSGAPYKVQAGKSIWDSTSNASSRGSAKAPAD
ncbi:MAG: hypothetical protein K1X53_03475 [Candidatus Sumerlaeaceae bacterium]|nr:hypothetical protein [Candidatus Sumerlaeaceae bacterium]